MVYGSGPENRQAERPRGFESHPLRQPVDAARTLIGRNPECFRTAEIRTPFDWWGASRAWVKSEALTPEPKRSFG